MYTSLALCSEWLESTSQLYFQVCESYERLSLAADDRAVKLERCLQLRQLEDRASTVCTGYLLVITRQLLSTMSIVATVDANI